MDRALQLAHGDRAQARTQTRDFCGSLKCKKPRRKGKMHSLPPSSVQKGRNRNEIACRVWKTRVHLPKSGPWK